MSLSYTLRESVSGFRRTKLSSVISVFTICISLLLLGVFVVVTLNASRFIESLRNKIELEAFLQEPISEEEVADLQRTVTSIEGVRKVTFISKEEAAQIFKKEFGEEITSVLDFNPLPPSFKIALKDGYKTLSRVEAISSNLKGLKGVESVVYRRTLLELIDQRTQSIHNIMLALGVVISLSAVFLVSNTIRLAIYARRKIVRTMELVGATSVFIRMPFLLEGMIQGFLGGVLAAGLLYLMLERALRWLSAEFSAYVHMDPLFYVLVVAAGTGLGLLGSIISVTRFIRPAKAS
jgi:cell division transport system permease protein